MNENKEEVIIDKASIKELFFGKSGTSIKTYRIPTYQRDYKWKITHVESLMDDICSRKRDKKEHYFGMIAISAEIADEISENIIKIMDGQQRIVTSFLVLYLINKISKDILKHIEENENTEDFMDEAKYSDSLKKVVGDLKELPKFKLDFEISSPFSISFTEWREKGKLKNSKSNFAKNISVIKKFLTSKVKVENFLAFQNVFMNKFFVGYINYKSTSVDDEIIIFENINAKGVALTDFEMISNYLISLPGSEDLKFEKLRKIRLNAAELINDYIKYAHKTFNKHKNTKIDDEKFDIYLKDFLKSYLKYKIISSNENNRKEKQLKYESFPSYSLYKNFKAYFKNKKGCSIDEYKKIIYEMSAFLYLFISFKKGVGVAKNNIWLFSYIEKQNHFPVLFAIFQKFASYNKSSLNKNLMEWQKIDSKEIKLFSKSIVEYHLKHLTVFKKGISLTNFWDNVLKEFVREDKINTHEDLRKLLRKDNSFPTPTHNEFKRYLLAGGSSTPADLKALIIILNKYGEKMISVNEKTTFTNQTSIEHVFPQKPHIKEWPLFFKNKPEKDKHTPYIHMIGNLVLVDKNDNSKLGNRNFNYKKENVFNDTGSLLVKGKCFGLPSIKSLDDWGPDVITGRSEKLITILKEIFDGDFI